MRIEKADRFWSAPSGPKPQVSCAWRVTLRGNAQRFSPTVTDATERTITMRTKFCTQTSTHHFLTIFHDNMSGALKLVIPETATTAKKTPIARSFVRLLYENAFYPRVPQTPKERTQYPIGSPQSLPKKHPAPLGWPIA